jgi:hypothetical protein
VTVLLVLCDVLGGFIALASGADSWQESWGFDTDTAEPLPVGLVQLALAWLAGRDVRPRVGLSAAVVLSLFCATSVLFGLFDGDLRGNVASDGLVSWQVIWGVVLLLVTATVGVLAAARARLLYRLRHAGT